MTRPGRPPHWFEPLADHLGEAYLRYSFTRGTDQEVEFLIEVLDLAPGDRVLDVGCGPGRHAHALAEAGLVVHGIDISARFVDLARRHAPPGATFSVGDARALSAEGPFDVAISLCQGAFGLTGGPAAPEFRASMELDEPVLRGMASAVGPGGRVAVSAFSAYFAMRWQEEGETFDAEHGVNHERTELRDGDGAVMDADLWTTCYTPRELRLLARSVGLRPEAVWSVTPGDYQQAPPTTDTPEFLLLANKP